MGGGGEEFHGQRQEAPLGLTEAVQKLVSATALRALGTPVEGKFRNLSEEVHTKENCHSKNRRKPI